MSVLTKILVVIILTLVLVVTAGYWYLHILEDQYSHTKTELALAKAAIKHAQEKFKIEQQACRAEVQLIKQLHNTDKHTTTEIKQKIKRGKDYEILAAREPCGCTFDGTGWVFK
jgi:uncharacterized protein HemX